MESPLQKLEENLRSKVAQLERDLNSSASPGRNAPLHFDFSTPPLSARAPRMQEGPHSAPATRAYSIERDYCASPRAARSRETDDMVAHANGFELASPASMQGSTAKHVSEVEAELTQLHFLFDRRESVAKHASAKGVICGAGTAASSAPSGSATNGGGCLADTPGGCLADTPTVGFLQVSSKGDEEDVLASVIESKPSWTDERIAATENELTQLHFLFDRRESLAKRPGGFDAASSADTAASLTAASGTPAGSQFVEVASTGEDALNSSRQLETLIGQEVRSMHDRCTSLQSLVAGCLSGPVLAMEQKLTDACMKVETLFQNVQDLTVRLEQDEARIGAFCTRFDAGMQQIGSAFPVDPKKSDNLAPDMSAAIAIHSEEDDKFPERSSADSTAEALALAVALEHDSLQILRRLEKAEQDLDELRCSSAEMLQKVDRVAQRPEPQDDTDATAQDQGVAQRVLQLEKQLAVVHSDSALLGQVEALHRATQHTTSAVERWVKEGMFAGIEDVEQMQDRLDRHERELGAVACGLGRVCHIGVLAPKPLLAKEASMLSAESPSRAFSPPGRPGNNSAEETDSVADRVSKLERATSHTANALERVLQNFCPEVDLNKWIEDVEKLRGKVDAHERELGSRAQERRQ